MARLLRCQRMEGHRARGSAHAWRSSRHRTLQGAPELLHLAPDRRARPTSSSFLKTWTTSGTRSPSPHRQQLPVVLLGGGNKVLVRDGGIRGVVVKLEGCLARADFHGEEAMVGAGMGLATLVRHAAAHDLGGIERARRHPGHARRRHRHERRHAGWLDRRLSVGRLLPVSGRHVRRVQAAGDPARPSAASTCPPDVGLVGCRLRFQRSRRGRSSARSSSGSSRRTSPSRWRWRPRARSGRIRRARPPAVSSRRSASAASAWAARRSPRSTRTTSSTGAAPARPTSSS